MTAVEPEEELRWSPFRIGVLILLLATVAWRFWTVSQWSWFQDDWLYVSEAQRMPFWDYVLQSYNSHLMPGEFLLAWTVTTLAPLEFAPAMVITLVLTVASVLTWAMAMHEIFGERFQSLIALTLIALSPLYMPVSLWWASALQVLPLQTFMGLCVFWLARYLWRGRQRRHQIALTVSYTLGLVFWQKAVLILVPLVFVALMLTQGRTRERLRVAAGALRGPLVVTLLYVPVYVFAVGGGVASPNHESFRLRGPDEAVEFYAHAVVDVGLPALAGGPWQALSSPYGIYTSPSGFQTMLLVGTAIGSSVLAVVFRRRAALALLMTVTYALVSWGLVLASGRYDDFAVDAARIGRYAADLLPVAALTCTFLSTPTLAETTDEALRRPLGLRTRSTIKRLLALYLAGAVVLSAWSSGTTWDATRPSSPKPWVDALTGDAARIGTATLFDSPTPETVIHPIWFFDQGRVSDVLGPLDLPLVYNQQTTQFVMADGTGHLKEAELLEPAAANVAPTPVPNCGYLVEPGRTTRIPLTIDLYDFEWVVQLDYFGETASRVSVKTDRKRVDLELSDGLSRVLFVHVDAISRLSLRGAPGSSPVCVTQVRIGQLAPTDRPAVRTSTR